MRLTIMTVALFVLIASGAATVVGISLTMFGNERHLRWAKVTAAIVALACVVLLVCEVFQHGH